MLGRAHLTMLLYSPRIASSTSPLFSSPQIPASVLLVVWMPFFISLSWVHWLFLRAYLKRFNCPSFLF